MHFNILAQFVFKKAEIKVSEKTRSFDLNKDKTARIEGKPLHVLEYFFNFQSLMEFSKSILKNIADFVHTFLNFLK